MTEGDRLEAFHRYADRRREKSLHSTSVPSAVHVSPEVDDGVIVRLLEQGYRVVQGKAPAMVCQMCGRKMTTESDGDDLDCGGDCWGCIREVESTFRPAA